MHRCLPVLAAALALATPALAQTPGDGGADTGPAVSAKDAAGPGFVIYTGINLEFTQDEYGRDTGFSRSFDSYLEAEFNGFYVGFYSMITDEEIDDEVDYYFGYRNELASGLSYDLGYTRYIYPNDGGNCCGEVTLGLYAPLGDTTAVGLDLAYDPQAKLGNVYVYGEYYLSDKWTLSANYGVYEVEDAPNEQEWDFGAGYAITDEAALDIRYYEGSDYDSYVAVAFSFDTSLFGD